MYCPKCGKELPESAQFCPTCGSSINQPELWPQFQDSSSPDQDIPSTNLQSAAAEQQNQPPVPNEEIKCPNCGAVGCMPQYKQNVSGGGYGCCSGGLGALVLGPLGLLCGVCGRSVKSTNTLVWICPKCGHEFQAKSKKDMKTGYITGCCLISLMFFLSSIFMLSIPDTGGQQQGFGMAVYAIGMVLMCAVCYPVMWYGGVCKARVAYTDEEKQQLKMVTIITGVISLICALLPVIF